MGPTSTNSAPEQRELVKIHVHLATLRMFSIVSVCSNAPLGITTKLRTLRHHPVRAPAPLDGSMTAFNCVLLPVPAATLGKPCPAITNVSRFVLTLLVILTLEIVHFLAPSHLCLPTVRLCVETCGNFTRFMQVAVGNANRTCVDWCESGQYGNPFTFKCSNYTMDCPDGYFADSRTRMCETNCTLSYQVAENSTKQCRNNCLTGFAHWESQACVCICPSNPPMLGHVANKVCVYSCNFSSTGLYGDAQANRTCVQTLKRSYTDLWPK